MMWDFWYLSTLKKIKIHFKRSSKNFKNGFSQKWRKLNLVLFTGGKKTQTKTKEREELVWETRMYLQRLRQKWTVKRTIPNLKVLYLTLLAILHNTDNLLDSLELFHKGNLQTKPALRKQFPTPLLAQLFISHSHRKQQQNSEQVCKALRADL